MTVIAVSGLRRESKIAGAPGVIALNRGNDPASLRTKLERALSDGAGAVISIGIAGGLAPSLRSGDCVIGSEIVTMDGGRIVTDRPWRERLLARLPSAYEGAIAASEGILFTAGAKGALYRATGALAVDMESHIAAEFAARHRLPLAALRVIADPSQSALPALAATAIGADGRVRVFAVLAKLLRSPAELPALLATGRQARVAYATLIVHRRALGAGLLGP